MAASITSDEGDICLSSTVLTVNIINQGGSVKASCTNTSGAGVSFVFGLDDTLGDLEAELRTKTPWLHMKFLANDGIAVDTCQKLSKFELLVVMDVTNERRLEVWKEKYPVVGKVLAAMNVDAFDPTSHQFDVKWKASTAPVVDPAEVDQLIVSALRCNTYKQQELHKPCVAIPFPSCPEVAELEPGTSECIAFSIQFLQVLGFLLQDAEAWMMMNLQLLQNFDPGLKFFKHKLYPNLVEVARLAAVKPLILTSLPLVAVFQKNSEGTVIGLSFCAADQRSDLRLDRTIRISLSLSDLKVEREWWNVTYRQVLWVLHMSSPLFNITLRDNVTKRDVEEGETHLLRDILSLSFYVQKSETERAREIEKEIRHSFPHLPSIEDASIPSILFNLQLRLSSQVCPVVIQGTLNVELVRLLAFLFNYHLTILQDEGDHRKFRDVGLLETSDENMSSNSLQGHMKQAQTKSSASKSRGTLLLVTDLVVGSSVLMAATCQRLKDLALPDVIQFVLLEDSNVGFS